MKKKIEIICFLCLAFGAINIKAQEVENLGWLNNVGGTYTYTDTANWNNGEINGVFGTNLTSKSTQTILVNDGFIINDLYFCHGGEVSYKFIGNGADSTAYITNDWYSASTTQKGSITFGSGIAGEGLTTDLGGETRKLEVAKTTVNFYSPIVNGDLELINVSVGLKGRNGSFPNGTLIASNAWISIGAENDTLTPAVRIDKLISKGAEITVYGHKNGEACNEKINTLVAETKPEIGTTTIKFRPASKLPILHIGKLERKNNALINLINVRLDSYDVGVTDFAPYGCHLLFDEVPAFSYPGTAGTTSCPIFPWLVYNYDMFYTYDSTRGVRPLDLETEVRTYSTNYVGELEAQGENIRITSDVSVFDITGEENSVNSIIWSSANNAKLYATNGVLKVLSGGIQMGWGEKTTLHANIDFGDVTGYINARNDKYVYLRGNIAGTKGVVLSTISASKGDNGGIFYVTGTGTFTSDCFISTAVNLQSVDFLPHGDRLGNTVVDGLLRLWYNTVTVNGLYGSGIVTFVNSDWAKLIVGDNDTDGDFGGRIYGRTLHLDKIGKGTQIIRRENSSTGKTTVLDGALYYESWVNAGVEVADGATLGGAGTFNATGTAIDLNSGATLIPMSYEGTGSMTVANDISFGGANTLKLTATPDALTPALNVGGSVIGADSEVDVVFEGEKPGIYTLVKAQTAIEPKFVSATPNFKVYTSEDGLTVYGEKLDMGTVVIIR